MALMPVDDALARILKSTKPLAVESVPLKQAHERVTAAPIKAVRDQPPFPASAMDGYAVNYADVETLPAVLKIVGTSAAGHAFRGKIKTGECVRILTGAPVPMDTDTVVIQENTVRDGAILRVLEPTPKAKNIRKQGLDFAKGTELIESGRILNARDLGLAAAGNAATIRVRKIPHIVVLTTGDELVLPGQRPRADQIVSSNSVAIQAMCEAWGARVTNLGIVRDTMKATEAAIRKGLGADIMITTGGASVGDHDFVQQALKNCGVKIDFWKIALRPGKPLMYGVKARTRVLGLPGNPVSALVCSRIFLKPLIDRLLGLKTGEHIATAQLGSDLPENDNRQDYVRATLSVAADGSRTATPYSLQDSSMQRALRNAQCLIIRKPFAPAAKTGETAEILILDF
jgi:molybdopterin molybdotransferase